MIFLGARQTGTAEYANVGRVMGDTGKSRLSSLKASDRLGKKKNIK